LQNVPELQQVEERLQQVIDDNRLSLTIEGGSILR
jgi:hypothetical protein